MSFSALVSSTILFLCCSWHHLSLRVYPPTIISSARFSHFPPTQLLQPGKAADEASVASNDSSEGPGEETAEEPDTEPEKQQPSPSVDRTLTRPTSMVCLLIFCACSCSSVYSYALCISCVCCSIVLCMYVHVLRIGITTPLMIGCAYGSPSNSYFVCDALPKALGCPHLLTVCPWSCVHWRGICYSPASHLTLLPSSTPSLSLSQEPKSAQSPVSQSSFLHPRMGRHVDGKSQLDHLLTANTHGQVSLAACQAPFLCWFPV